MKYPIFISYKRVDKDRVFRLKAQIDKSVGVESWIDLEGIESDAQFANVIIRAINQCEVFLFMYSSSHSEIEDYNNDWTIKEIDFASAKKKRIVFVNIDGTPLSDWFLLMFGTKQHVDGTSEDAVRRLCRDLSKWLECSSLKDVGIEEEKEVLPSVNNSPKSKYEIYGYEYVDLGLPSGLKWATCNVGAESPEDYGDYYAWGETSTKSEYTKENSLTYGKSMSDISGNITYDVARKKWGSSWRLPTRSEFEELIDNCEWTWTTQNGKRGYKVTGPNGNNIFLPAAGCRYGSSLDYVGEGGLCWSSTPSVTRNACYLYFDGSGHRTHWSHRNCGQSVRPVSE